MNAAAKLFASMRRKLSVPAHRPIKPIYVQKFVELVEGA